ncbi:Nuclear transcription factor Y subunit C-4 [Hondaea fermentalgiana]|uniref:Nuclear transcription factor Y subunit C-4 n=1 Tax=Hondaea fermentalgiana TaxID=2315210 RepID=A0A2R5GNX6_9STRA|nr:Nuclear transcription factor Y subunit C-4 [Hondaea fermentalgiana]|eukprot:GBG31468.1 Nuclear transcription factor Y subunit C-4 [Hondaea fermentalgiana]
MLMDAPEVAHEASGPVAETMTKANTADQDTVAPVQEQQQEQQQEQAAEPAWPLAQEADGDEEMKEVDDADPGKGHADVKTSAASSEVAGKSEVASVAQSAPAPTPASVPAPAPASPSSAKLSTEKAPITERTKIETAAMSIDEVVKAYFEGVKCELAKLDPSTCDFKSHTDIPFQRVKRIIKSDEDVRIASTEAVVMTAMAANMFLADVGRRTYAQAEGDQRTTVTKEDVEAAIRGTDIFDFLLEIVDEKLLEENRRLRLAQE